MALQLPGRINYMNLPAIDQSRQQRDWNALRQESEQYKFDQGKQTDRAQFGVGLINVIENGIKSDPTWYKRNYPKLSQALTEHGMDISELSGPDTPPEQILQEIAEARQMMQAGLPQQADPKLAKDAAGFNRFAGGPNFGQRAFPDVVAPEPGQSGGVTGSLQELNAINADREQRGEEPMEPEVYLKERRRSSADMQAYSQYVIDSQRAGETPMSEQDFKLTREGGIAGAKTTGSGEAQRELDIPSAFALHNQTTQNFTRLGDAVTSLEGDDALWKAVGIAKSMAIIPGQQGADIRARIMNIKSQVGFMVLQDMRNASKTGGALGQVSEKENELLQANLAALDENMSPEAFRASLRTIQDYLLQAQFRLDHAWKLTYPELDTFGNKAGSAPLTGQTTAIPENDVPVLRYDAQGNRIE